MRERLRRWFSTGRALARLDGRARARLERDVDDEIAFHVESRVDALVAQGLDRRAARATALGEFGDRRRYKAELLALDQGRAVATRRRHVLDAVGLDLSLAVRQLGAHPGFSTAVVLTLALGAGANIAIFSLVDALLLRPLPYADPGRLVSMADVYDGRASGAGQAEFHDWVETASSFEDLALSEYDAAVIPGDDRLDAERVLGTRVTAGFFDVLGARPLLGRTFLPGEDLPGRADVIVVGHRLWQRRFGGDPGAIGRPVRLDDGIFTIVGVMPASFYWVESPSAEFWRPLGYTSSGRMQHQYGVVGRLAPGVSLDAAQAQMTALARRAAEAYPDAKGWTVLVSPLGADEAAAARTPLVILAGAVGLVLLIACANVANLLLARVATRSLEMAVRTALGAGRTRLARQLLVETGVLAALGCTLGALLAFWLLPLLVTRIPPAITPASPVGIDARALGFALALLVLTTLVVGLAPVRRLSRCDVFQALKPAGAISPGGPDRRLLGRAVVLEVALASVLLVSTGLLGASLVGLVRRDLGFRPRGVSTAEVRLPRAAYERSERAVFFDALLERVAAMPGVESTGGTSALPASGYYSGFGLDIEGRPSPAEWRTQSAQLCDVTPGYFRTMGIRLVEGRDFTPDDREGAPRVGIISEGMARRFWPDGGAVGSRIAFRGSTTMMTIVGVVGDTRYGGPAREPNATLYRPYAQAPSSELFIAARLTGSAASIVPAVRRALREMDPSVSLVRAASLDDLVSGTLMLERALATLVAAFSLLALALAAVGLYGVVAQSVTRRTREIGVRMALGATRGQVLGLVLGQGLGLTGGGVALGLLLSAAGTRWLEALLYGVSATDARVFLAVTLVVGLVALVASYVPARRAVSIDPIAALRAE